MTVHEHSGEILPYEAIPKLGYSRAPGVPGQEAPGGSRGQHITCAHGGQKERRCREWLGGSVRLLKVPENGLQEKSRVIWQTSPEKRIHLGTLEWGKQGDWAGFRLGGDRFTKKTFTFGMLVKPLHNICSLWSWKKKKKWQEVKAGSISAVYGLHIVENNRLWTEPELEGICQGPQIKVV